MTIFQVFEGVNFPLIRKKCKDFIKTARNANRPIHARWFRTDSWYIIFLKTSVLIDLSQLRIRFLC